MDQQIRRLATAMTVLFGVLIAQIVVVQWVRNDSLIAHPSNARRLIVQEYRTDRGDILARDGSVLAESVPTQGEFRFLRRYAHGNLFGQLTGYYSIPYGTRDLENSFNAPLAARGPEFVPQSIVDLAKDEPKVGATITTTIDPQLQDAASRALKGRLGAVAAIDPRTGDVLAMASNPTYNPNDLSSHDLDAVRRSWDRYNRDPDKPMLSKAIGELYPPGSTFKIITAAAALENGYGPGSSWPNPQQLSLPLTTNTLQNFGGRHCASGAATITLSQAFTESCDVTFAEIGMELGPEAMYEQARAFGFSNDVPFDIPYVDGVFPPPEHFEQNDPLLAFASIGQDEVSANPMQMALVSAAIANGGTLMQPRLVTEIQAPDGTVLEAFEPTAWGQAVSPETAAELTTMMENAVANGTGTAARISGVAVAGKTGTAQHAKGAAPHLWFTGFAPADDPQIAVAVVLLEGGGEGDEATGGQVAAPVVKRVMEAALKMKEDR